MPRITPAYPLGDDAAMLVIDEAADAERLARQKEIDRAFAYYEGRQRLPLRSEADGSNASVILNLTAQALDDMVEFMGLPRFEIPGGVTQAREADGTLVQTISDDQRALDGWWEAQDLAEFLIDVAISGFCAGHTFVKLYAGDDEVPQATLLDPRMMTVFWDARNVSRPLWYRMAWASGDEQRRQDIVPNRLVAPERWSTGSEPDGWQIFETVQKAGGRFEVAGQDAWNYPFAPIVEWKNRHAPHQYYGRTETVTGLNDAVNFTASNVAKILKHHAGPQTIVTGARLDDETPTGPGTIINDLPADAKVFNLEMQSDLSSSLAYLDKLELRFFGEMQVVDLSTVKDKLGQITNFGVRMLFIRMTNLIAGKRRLYGKGLAAISRAVLAMQGIEAGRVDVHWEAMLPANRLEQVSELQGERALGVVSKETTSADLGRDFDDEQAKIALEASTAATVAADSLVTLANGGLFA